MSSYSRIAQHEPLRVPETWTGEARRFVTQLEEVLDDIYRRFGRLTLSDMSTDLQKTFTKEQQSVESLISETQKHRAALNEHTGTLTAHTKELEEHSGALEDHTAKLKALDEAVPDELVNDSMSLSKDGLVLSKGAFRVAADEGFVQLGDYFRATHHGDVSAKSGGFSDSLLVGGKPVMRQGDIVVSGSQPSGSGILWVKPETVQSVTYSMPTGEDTILYWKDSSLEFVLSPANEDTLADGAFVYTISLPLFGAAGSDADVSVSASLSREGSDSIAFPAYTIERLGYLERKDIELTVESSVNLMNSASPLRLTVAMNGVDSDGLYLHPNEEIRLDARFKDATVQACTVYWIP